MTDRKEPDNRSINMGEKGNYNELINRDYVHNQVNIYNRDSSRQQQNCPEMKSILQALADFFNNNSNSGTGDSEISEALGINIHKVRVCFQELSKQGYIEVLDGADHQTGERLIVIGLTSEGWVYVDSQRQ
jgi:DNA-binding MarR family transcriptional regulator